MARLVVKSDGFRNQIIELHLGLNRLGRSPENDFQIEHASISASHCEVVLGAHEVIVRDCDSTNGTFVDGEQVKEAQLHAGETLSLGDVELLVQSTDVRIAIPKIERPPRARRRGGKVLKLCPLCSHKCESLAGEGKKKKSILGFLQKTVKLPFLHARPKQD